MQRLKNVICHPSRIGLYHKDNISIVLLYLFLFIAFLLGFLAIKAYNTTYFDNTDMDYIITLVENNKKEVNTEYKDHKLSGESLVVSSSSLECYFLPTIDINSVKTSEFVIFLKEDGYSMYYGYRLLSSGKYADIEADYSFTIANVRANDSKSVFSFKGLLDYVFTKSNSGYATHVFLVNMLQIFQYYFIFSVLVMAVYSYFINPGIAMGKRSKLVIYDSLIYFIVMFFTIAFEFQYLQYAAIILPFIYCSFTFSHIIRVRK